MRLFGLIAGIVVLTVGILWTLQGLNVVGGSFMSGNGTFIVVGSIVGLVGLGLIIGTRLRAPSAK